MEKRNSQLEHARLRCGSLSITTPVPLLGNKFDVRSVLHGQESLAAVNQICVIHEATNGFKNLKIYLRIALGMQIFDNGLKQLYE